MSNSIVANRYAAALFQVAKENDQVALIGEQMRVVKEVLQQTPELLFFLKLPKVDMSKKKELVQQAFSTASPFIVNTLLLMMENHREDNLLEMAEEYIALANNERGIAEATVTSVRPLNEEEKSSLSAVLAEKVGKQTLKIENVVDPKLLGGLKVRIGNRIIDGSLRGKLDRLKQLIS
ncbi:F0F1 ATP synthase subunit delta [Bacillus smithii]|uniref:F0F1 ATP synthase subunit delta n=1 Tax=Bacillus smithii TaxID=1479 RepID=UPI0030C9741A